MSGKIFINYRRSDEPGFAHALVGRLEEVFSPDQLFMDIDISAGADFVRFLEDQVAQCGILLAVIGKNWLDARDETGGRRLDNPDDFVRIEIESALKQSKLVIPVLVNGVCMPPADELPEGIRALARRNTVELSHRRFRTDVQGLIKAIQQELEKVEALRRTHDEAPYHVAEEERTRAGQAARKEGRDTSPRRPPTAVAASLSREVAGGGRLLPKHNGGDMAESRPFSRPSGSEMPWSADVARPVSSDAQEPLPSTVDIIIDQIFLGDDRRLFREHLRRFEGFDPATRQAEVEPSAAELELLRRAKSDFQNREALANEICCAMTSEDVKSFFALNDVLCGLSNLVSLDRVTEILRQYACALCREGDASRINRLTRAYREVVDARESNEYRRLEDALSHFVRNKLGITLFSKIGGSLDEFTGLRPRPLVPMWFKLDEQKIATVQDHIRNHHAVTWRTFDRFIWPEVVFWSSRSKAQRLLRELANLSNADIMNRIRVSLAIVAEVLGQTVAKDASLKRALARESLTGKKVVVPLSRLL